ncbi:MAG: protein-L-isoaspartate O-methyltransferase [Proteobacteria bacterium]|nr:protein-L-isoaspartate O-methyltransferase [Pseudomonadota bacterium]
MPSPVAPRLVPLVVLLLLVSSVWPSLACAQDATVAPRQKMVEQIAAIARVMGGSTDGGTLDPRVMATMAAVPRHEFVPAEQKPHAYDDRPLPIGHGQTISQPYMVAAMTDLMKPKPDHVVLEIGTGSGYQAAVLAGLVREVYTIEIVDALARQAAARLTRLGYGNVTTKSGDGYYGWPEHGPYDSIMVTAASSHIPPPLLRQLKPGGRMVIPIGAPFMTQQLMLVEKNADGTVTTRQMMAVRFVPLTGSH